LPAQKGTVQDLDADGDLDVGSNLTSLSNNYINATRQQMLFNGSPGDAATPDNEYLLETVTFNVVDANLLSNTAINFFPRVATMATPTSRRLNIFTTDGTR